MDKIALRLQPGPGKMGVAVLADQYGRELEGLKKFTHDVDPVTMCHRVTLQIEYSEADLQSRLNPVQVNPVPIPPTPPNLVAQATLPNGRVVETVPVDSSKIKNLVLIKVPEEHLTEQASSELYEKIQKDLGKENMLLLMPDTYSVEVINLQGEVPSAPKGERQQKADWSF